jgi:molybdopterin-guanine dinucleotide biosynthesis protein A
VSRTDVAGIVLAGGRSRRFGSDKLAVLLRDGRPILAHAVGALEGLCDEVVVVIAPDAPEPEGLPPSTRIVRDPESFGGPVVGLSSGLAAVQAERVLVVGGDMPRLVPGVLGLLIQALDDQPAVDVVRLEPPRALGADLPEVQPTLPSVFRRTAAVGVVNAALVAGDRRLRGVFERMRVGVVPEAVWRRLDPEGLTLTDVDRPQDLAAES